MNSMKRLVFSLIILISSSSYAEIKVFQSTDNTGLNKKERIDAVESYLADLSNSLKSMESKLDDNAKKLKLLDDVVKVLKDTEAKKTEDKLGEKKISTTSTKEQSEVDKIKADILTMKNKDIEKLKVNLEELSDTVKAIQATLREK